MLPRKRLALTLVAAGALACTTVSALPSFAADAHEAEAASNTGVSLDAQQTVIVQLEDGADREGVRQRIDQAVAAATPGASTEYVRDYHHVFEGFAVKAPSSALAAIKGVQGVQAVVSDGMREPIVYPEIVGGPAMRSMIRRCSPAQTRRLSGARGVSLRSSTRDRHLARGLLRDPGCRIPARHPG